MGTLRFAHHTAVQLQYAETGGHRDSPRSDHPRNDDALTRSPIHHVGGRPWRPGDADRWRVRHLPRRHGRRSVSLAGEWRRSQGACVERRAGRADASLSRRPRGAQADLRAPVPAQRPGIAILRRPAPGGRQDLCDLQPAAQAAAHDCDAAAQCRSGSGARHRRSQCAQHRRHHGDRLVRAVARWEQACSVALRAR